MARPGFALVRQSASLRAVAHSASVPLTKVAARGLLLLGCSLVSVNALAQAAGPYPGNLDNPALYTLDPNSPFNALEIAAAQANQATYNSLLATCGGNRAVNCTAAQLSLLRETGQLVQTANALLGSGPTALSLGLSATGLRLALRWTAATEVAALGSINTRFAANQLSTLATRLSALRWGSGGIAQASLAPGDGAMLAAAGQQARALGGGASADAESVGSRLSSYFDTAYDYGKKAPTVYEDAFAFDGQEFTLGTDYRWSRRLVTGVMVGYSKKRVDFNSDLSTVDGNVRATGYSALFYGMLEGEKAYVSLAGGYQRLSYDILRRITYPSLNLNVPSVDSTATSNTNSGTFLASLNAGYAEHWRAFIAEPFFDARYSDVRIDAFQETARQTNTSTPTAFGTEIAPQSVHSMELAAGLKLQAVWTPSHFGVVSPYVTGAYHNQLADKARNYTATYTGAQGLATLAAFELQTDPAPTHWYTGSAGVTLVLPHGFQGFAQYARVFKYTNYSDSIISGGFRVEF